MAPQVELSTLAAWLRSPWTVSLILMITRLGVSAELRLLMSFVKSTRSPTLERLVHSLSIMIDGWNRLTESVSLLSMSLVRPGRVGLDRDRVGVGVGGADGHRVVVGDLAGGAGGQRGAAGGARRRWRPG